MEGLHQVAQQIKRSAMSAIQMAEVDHCFVLEAACIGSQFMSDIFLQHGSRSLQRYKQRKVGRQTLCLLLLLLLNVAGNRERACKGFNHQKLDGALLLLLLLLLCLCMLLLPLLLCLCMLPLQAAK